MGINRTSASRDPTNTKTSNNTYKDVTDGNLAKPLLIDYVSGAEILDLQLSVECPQRPPAIGCHSVYILVPFVS
jgi:hypothetical protein